MPQLDRRSVSLLPAEQEDSEGRRQAHSRLTRLLKHRGLRLVDEVGGKGSKHTEEGGIDSGVQVHLCCCVEWRRTVYRRETYEIFSKYIKIVVS